MHELSHFTLKPLNNALPRSVLLFDSKETGVVVDGRVLEREILLTEGYLLLLTEDCPYEEGLHIYLFDKDFHILDGIELAMPYASGILRDFCTHGKNDFSFSFFADEHWQLKILEQPVRVFNISLYSAIKHKGGFFPSCRLSLKRT